MSATGENINKTSDDSHPQSVAQTQRSSTTDDNLLAKQHADQMARLEAAYLSKLLSDRAADKVRKKVISSSTEMLDRRSSHHNPMRIPSSSNEVLNRVSTNDNKSKIVTSSSIERLDPLSINDNQLKISSSSTQMLAERSVNGHQTRTVSSSNDALRRVSTNESEPKTTSSASETLNELSVDRLYEFLRQYDHSLQLLAEKLKNQCVSGADLMRFEADDYANFSVTYTEKKKLKVLIEQHQSNSHASSNFGSTNASQMQNELDYLKVLIEKHEQQMQEKDRSIAQLEAIIHKKDQQIEQQDSMMKQFQATIEKQNEQVLMLMKLVNQNATPASSAHPVIKNIFAQQSSVVQDQLINILDNIAKVPIVPLDTPHPNIPVVEANVPTAIQLYRTSLYIPAGKTSLPTSCAGPNSSTLHFAAVYHPDQSALVTKPILEDSYDMSNYGAYTVTVYSEDTRHVIAETLLTVVPEIEICVPKQIVVRDSINNIIVGGIVTVRRVGEDVAIFTGRTDDTGTVALSDTFADGAYEVEVHSPTNPKLQHLKFIMLIFQNRRQGLIHRCIGRSDLMPNQMHMVLEWGGEPKDLDSHLFSSDGKHVYYRHRNDDDMMLDCDVTHGYGPETMTFTIQPNLKYVYAVHRFSNEPKLTQSKARVTFNLDPELTQFSKVGSENTLANGEVHRIPEVARSEARFWIVCMIDGSTKQIKFFPNTFEDHNGSESSAIGMKYFTA